MAKDLTVGSPGKVLTWFALPMVVSVVFQQFYNIADNVVAGQLISDNALAAVSISYPMTMIYMAFALGINIGCSVVISQLFGSRQFQKMKTGVSTALLATGGVALVLTALGLLLMGPILTLLRTPAEIFSDTRAYLMIYTAGLLFIFIYNICTGTFTAMGDSTTPLIFLILSSVANVFLDVWFVVSFHMGVAGCALATFLCQGAAALAAFVVLRKKLHQLSDEPYEKFSPSLLRQISVLAIPGILQQSFVSVGNLLIQGLVNGYDLPAIIGGYGAAVKLNTFAVTMLTTLSNSVSSFTAQNIGANQPERVPKGVRGGILLSLCVVLPFFVLYVFFGDVAMRLFVKAESTEVIAVGVTYLRIVAPFYAVAAAKLVCDGVLHGTGAVKCFMATTFTDLIIRVVLAYILPHWFGYVGIWMSWPVGWCVSAALSVWFYTSGKWKGTGFLERL
ncbi:MAG: MATE family efflux transporter, partial [Oscillospiraceae bacterium]